MSTCRLMSPYLHVSSQQLGSVSWNFIFERFHEIVNPFQILFEFHIVVFKCDCTCWPTCISTQILTNIHWGENSPLPKKCTEKYPVYFLLSLTALR
jgi:hypothetical protein